MAIQALAGALARQCHLNPLSPFPSPSPIPDSDSRLHSNPYLRPHLCISALTYASPFSLMHRIRTNTRENLAHFDYLLCISAREAGRSQVWDGARGVEWDGES